VKKLDLLEFQGAGMARSVAASDRSTEKGLAQIAGASLPLVRLEICRRHGSKSAADTARNLSPTRLDMRRRCGSTWAVDTAADAD
jgi:hypothetical protein